MISDIVGCGLSFLHIRPYTVKILSDLCRGAVFSDTFVSESSPEPFILHNTTQQWEASLVFGGLPLVLLILILHQLKYTYLSRAALYLHRGDNRI